MLDAERNTPEGKTSSVHFLVFRFDDGAAGALRDPAVRATLEIEHGNHGHSAALGGPVRTSLAADLA